jgi:hypothetical protein
MIARDEDTASARMASWLLRGAQTVGGPRRYYELCADFGSERFAASDDLPVAVPRTWVKAAAAELGLTVRSWKGAPRLVVRALGCGFTYVSSVNMRRGTIEHNLNVWFEDQMVVGGGAPSVFMPVRPSFDAIVPDGGPYPRPLYLSLDDVRTVLSVLGPLSVDLGDALAADADALALLVPDAHAIAVGPT